jgi:hypothetical protein
MRLYTFALILRLLSLAALGVLGVFIFGVDPASLTLAGQGLFFFALGLFFAAGVTLGLVSLANRFLDERAATAYLPGALRQGCLVGLYVSGIATAQFLGYLTWWIVLLALAFILLIEFTVRQFSRS